MAFLYMICQHIVALLDVSSILQVTVTRPDIASSVHMLSQFMQDPCTFHMDAATRVLRYLKGSLGKGILLSLTISFTVSGF